MNARDKRLVIAAYQLGVKQERERVIKYEQGKESIHAAMNPIDSAKSMAIAWANNAEYTGGWDVIDESVGWY